MKNNTAKERLRNRAKLNDPDGTALHNLPKITLDFRLIEDILACIKSVDPLDISYGLYFTIGLLQKYKLEDFGKEFTTYLINIIPTLFTKEQNAQVRMYALEFYVWLRDNYPSYRKNMLQFLNSDDLTQRRCALNNYETYCKDGEVKPLLIFQKDKLVSELSMCGPLEYQSRNIALEKIGKILGKNFMLNKVKEFNEDWNDDVSFYDWKPFLDWYSGGSSS